MGLMRWLFGEAGAVAVTWILDNILWFAIPIFIFAVFYKYDPQNRLKNWFHEKWLKWRETKLAKYYMSDEERNLIDDYKNKAKERNAFYKNSHKKKKQ